jgi:hypothetical protein
MYNFTFTVNFSYFNRRKFINYIIEFNGFCNIVLTARRTTVQGKYLGHQFYPCDFMYHKNTFHRMRKLLILNILLLVAAPPSPLRPRQLPCLPTPRPGSARHFILTESGKFCTARSDTSKSSTIMQANRYVCVIMLSKLIINMP